MDAAITGRPDGGAESCGKRFSQNSGTDSEKNELQPHRQKCWGIPPKHNAAFVACMEDVLDIYSWEYDETHPVVCMDEQPTQLVRETRQPLPTRRGAPKQYDFEYQRNGMANSFLFTEPLAGWRKVSVRATKTKKDWASEVQLLLDHDYPDAELVILVCDNLNTHTFGALYDTFDPEEAKRLADRLDIRHTPKHGSWMNMAEIELSAMTRQCLSRRIADIATLRSETNRWAARRNRNQTGINWQFKTGKARTKLKSLYPQILTT